MVKLILESFRLLRFWGVLELFDVLQAGGGMRRSPLIYKSIPSIFQYIFAKGLPWSSKGISKGFPLDF